MQLPGEHPRDHRPGEGDEDRSCPRRFVFVGGHSASFVAAELLDHAEGAIDCVLKGEGETIGRPAGRGRRRLAIR